jgi:uridine kinase
MNLFNFDKIVILLRGVSNGGKSTTAQYLQNIHKGNEYLYRSIICCADDYFTDNLGNYNFDAKKLYLAHKECQENFELALKDGIELVICSNTNTKESDFKFYINKAKEYNYFLFSLVVEKRFEGGDNGHDVPEIILNKQEESIKSSLKLR